MEGLGRIPIQMKVLNLTTNLKESKLKTQHNKWHHKALVYKLQDVCGAYLIPKQTMKKINKIRKINK